MEAQTKVHIQCPVKEIREKWGLSQREFAHHAGYKSASVVCEIELGTHEVPEKMLMFLRSSHVDIEEVIQQQRAFMESKDNQRIKRVAEVISEDSPEDS